MKVNVWGQVPPFLWGQVSPFFCSLESRQGRSDRSYISDFRFNL